jgi:hypothetical protein
MGVYSRNEHSNIAPDLRQPMIDWDKAFRGNPTGMTNQRIQQLGRGLVLLAYLLAVTTGVLIAILISDHHEGGHSAIPVIIGAVFAVVCGVVGNFVRIKAKASAKSHSASDN